MPLNNAEPGVAKPKDQTTEAMRRELLGLAMGGFLAAAIASCAADKGPQKQETKDAGSRSSGEDAGHRGHDLDAGPPASDGGPEQQNSDADAGASRADAGDGEHTDHVDPTDNADSGVGTGTVDLDRDGYTEADGDCDDLNRRAHPGAKETALDGVDTDCDGEELPSMKMVWTGAAKASENPIDALALLDRDADGIITLAEFARRCATSAKLSEAANPGIVQVHAACAGANSCRGMVYQSWNEIYEHSCRGVNYCSGWSCVETANDEQRTGAQAFEAAHCNNCHTVRDDKDDPIPNVFKVQIPPNEDPIEFLEGYWDKRSDAYLRSIIAFGVAGVTGSEHAYTNMPGAYHLISYGEIDSLIGYLRGTQVQGKIFDPLATPEPIEPQ